VVLGVRHHVDRRGDAVRHVEEADDVGEVEEVLVAEPVLLQRLAVGIVDQVRRQGELPGEVEQRALARRQLGHAIVHHQHLAELGILGEAAHRLAVRNQAVVAAVGGGDDDSHHLALQLGEPGLAKHQVVVERDEGAQLLRPQRIALQHVRHQAELLAAEVVVLAQVGIERRLRRDLQAHHTFGLRHRFFSPPRPPLC